jgi:hypothetical protein
LIQSLKRGSIRRAFLTWLILSKLGSADGGFLCLLPVRQQYRKYFVLRFDVFLMEGEHNSIVSPL